MSLPTAGSPPLTGASRAAGAPRELAGAQVERRFVEAYEQHHQALYRYCRSILRSDEDAQDALQTTMLKAFSALQGDTRNLDLRPWLFRVAHNECITLVRRRKATTPLELTHDVGVDTLPQAVEDRARLAQLQRDLADLPERQRSALILREFSGLSHEEIAVVLDSSARAIKQTIFEARRGLHECAEGRGMTCDTVQRTLSDADGRVVRSRKIRAHLRDCDSCALFAAAMTERPQQLGALVPALPVFAASALLADLLGGSGSAALGAGATAAGAAGTATVGAASATSGAAGTATAGAVGATAAATTSASAVAGATGSTLLAGLSGKAVAVIAAAVVATGGGAATVAKVAGPSGATTEQRSGDPSGPGSGDAAPSAAAGGIAAGDASTSAGTAATTPRTPAEAKAAAANAKAARDAAAGSNGSGESAPGRAAAASAKDAATARQAAAKADAAIKRAAGQQKAATKRATSKTNDRSTASTRPSPASTKPAARTPAPAKKTPSTPPAPSADAPSTEKPAAKSPRVEAAPAPATSAPQAPEPAVPERATATPDASSAAGRAPK